MSHDPLVCGLDTPGTVPTCPGCIAESRARSLVGEELARIAEKFAAADKRAKAAAEADDLAAGAWERRQAEGEFMTAEVALADVLLLLLRVGLRRRPEALASYLADALRPELSRLAESVARLEAR